MRFVRDVVGDPERAAEIEQEDLDDYAARKKVQIVNPSRSTNSMPTSKQLRQRISELEQENQDLSDQLDAIADIISPGDEDEDDDDNDSNGDEDDDDQD